MRVASLCVVFSLLLAGSPWAADEVAGDPSEIGAAQAGDYRAEHGQGPHGHAGEADRAHDAHDREQGDGSRRHIAHEEALLHDAADSRHGDDHGASSPAMASEEGAGKVHDEGDERRVSQRDDGHGHGHDHPAENYSGHDEHRDESHPIDSHHDHGNADGGHDEHVEEVHLRPEQIQVLGLKTERLLARPVGAIVQAPGEVRINRYSTDLVAPRIGAQIVARHARLGDHVDAGQPLVTLSSVEMAAVQGAAVVAAREWRRVRSLGRRVVAENRYLEAQIAGQQSRAKVISYGMTSEQVDALLRDGASKADGRFMLLAPRAGTVVDDDFILGEIIAPGRALFEITDESVRWVKAGFSPSDAAQVRIGNVARINTGSITMSGRVAQIHHLLDETTRTRAVRIEVPDPDHRLHPGEFVDVAIEVGEGAPVLALPEAAVLRSQDGDWQVFVAGDEPGVYRPVEVHRRYATGGLAVIDGIAAGTEVVTHGAFFLASERAKGGFDPHNH